MRSYIREKCRQCLTCQKSKITRQSRAPAHQNQEPPGRFQEWRLNLTWPLPNTSGCRYMVVAQQHPGSALPKFMGEGKSVLTSGVALKEIYYQPKLKNSITYSKI